MNIELNDDERSLAAYAVRELANRRLEQAIDSRRNPEMQKGCRHDAWRLDQLDKKLSQATPYRPLPEIKPITTVLEKL